MFSLFPKHEDFFDLFKKQSELVRRGCDQLHEMMERFDDLEARSRRLKDVEHDADLITHEIFERLNRTFITPLEREDIHHLASGLDDVLDSAEAIANRLVLFKVQASTPEARQLTSISPTADARSISGDQPQEHEGAHAVHDRDQPARERSRHGVAASGRRAVLRPHEFLDVLRWKEIYGRLENAADNCEDVANVIESIVLKSR
jgi:uncharacterized protein Yka (UPF0111/DUF47 family)